MPGSALADRAAALLRLTAATEERSLSQLTALAASQVPGCTAAYFAVWRDGELISQAASHPEPSRLVEIQLRAGSGPLQDALTNGGPVICQDFLTDQRWPELAAAALQMGIRSVAVLAYRDSQADQQTRAAGEADDRGQADDRGRADDRGLPGTAVTLALFGVRPRAIDASQLQLAELLVAYGGALVGAVSEYDDTRRIATQLTDAANSRAIVDQAKGILMHALSCTADQALDRMREVSQRTSLRATEVAQRIIDAHSRPGQASRPGDLGQLAQLAKRGRRNAG